MTPKDPDSLSFPTAMAEESGEERTAIVNLPSMGKLLREQTKDRHLLVRVNGAALGQVTRLPPEPCRVGRAQDCEIFVCDDGVSRKHALFIPVGGSYVVEDAGSANGTFVSGVRVHRHLLRDGETVQFGPAAAFRYTLTDGGQEALLRQLFEASVTDALTGAHNRDFFDTQLRSELSFARRHKTELSVVLFDVDHFKNVNDTYGHPAGDEVLIQIARTMAQLVRNEDVFARYGGEEFVLILRGIGLTGAASLGERLRASIEGLRVLTERGEVRVTISVGCSALGPDHDVKPETLISVADARLYVAKRSGRNRVVASD